MSDYLSVCMGCDVERSQSPRGEQRHRVPKAVPKRYLPRRQEQGIHKRLLAVVGQHSLQVRVLESTALLLPSVDVAWLYFRLRAHFPDDENADMVKSFNEGMRSYFAEEAQAQAQVQGQGSDVNHGSNNICAHVNYVDVYNMTAQLALNHSDVAPQLTYDSVHWGKEFLICARLV
jgi:hypothetical protein